MHGQQIIKIYSVIFSSARPTKCTYSIENSITATCFGIMIGYGIFVNCNWVDTRWQQYSAHLHTNSTQNNTMKQNIQMGTYVTIRIHK